MNVDCQWIEENLEALFCDRLSTEQDRLTRLHLENCLKCREKVEHLKSIDPLIKQVFRYDLAASHTPRQRRSPVVIGAFGTALVAMLLLIVVQVQHRISTPTVPAPPAMVASTPVPEPPPIPKSQHVPATPGRAKPEEVAPDRSVPDVQPRPPAVGEKTPEFLVTDPAGYSRTLNDYRGYVLIFGVWNSAQPRSVANLERIYKAVGANTKLRVLGVSEKREMKPANATFPTAYNQASALIGATAGQFFVLDANGTVQLRGNLLDDPSNVLTSVRNALEPLGIHVR